MSEHLTRQQVSAIRVKAAIADLDPDQLVAGAVPVPGGDGAVAVRWCGMWLCVETDGHVHT